MNRIKLLQSLLSHTYIEVIFESSWDFIAFIGEQHDFNMSIS